MKNKIQIHIAGRDYAFTSEDNAEEMQQIADYVSEQYTQVEQGGRHNQLDSTVLTAMNIAHALFQERKRTENLRRQLKQALDDAAQAELKLKEMNRPRNNNQNRGGNRKK